MKNITLVIAFFLMIPSSYAMDPMSEDTSVYERDTPVWKELKKLQALAKELKASVQRMKELDISPNDLIELRNKFYTFLFSRELQAAHECAHEQGALLRILIKSEEFEKTGIYQTSNFEAFFKGRADLLNDIQNFLKDYHDLRRDFKELESVLVPHADECRLLIYCVLYFANLLYPA